MRNDEMYLQLYLIRHGESMGNIETDEDYDKTNPPLTSHGRKQAEALGKRFSFLDKFTLYASPLDRARETASFISNDIIIDAEMLEKGVRQTDGGFEDYNETDAKCYERAKKVIEKIKAKHRSHENVIIVAHGMFLNQLIKAALDIPYDLMRLSVYNASVTKINFCEDEPTKLALQNDVAHLTETDGEKLFWM
ncbi:MAG: histidine phosphatase family protein [Clostridia bacterium]|nr:histidine phosphatase family protein [Clostridia bacterium]